MLKADENSFNVRKGTIPSVPRGKSGVECHGQTKLISGKKKGFLQCARYCNRLISPLSEY